MATSKTVEGFLARRRLALVGVSRDPKDFSRGVYRELLARGYDLVPVNPALQEVEGRKCFPRVQDVAPPVEGALIMTPARASEGVVRDCAAAGVRSVWLHRGGGQGAVSPEAVAFCREQGMEVVPGACPYMFLSGASAFHRFHGWVLTLFGKLPA
ncbi:MAG TPA: CoA-binding protein [Vicinamibacteria bacterium]|nr:CoA-binding protein [Vicinamibacteria bacterium]